MYIVSAFILGVNNGLNANKWCKPMVRGNSVVSTITVLILGLKNEKLRDVRN